VDTKEERDAERERRYPPIEYAVEYTYYAVIHGRRVKITRYQAPHVREKTTVITTSSNFAYGLATAGLADCLEEGKAPEVLTTTDLRKAIAPSCDFSYWARRPKECQPQKTN